MVFLCDSTIEKEKEMKKESAHTRATTKKIERNTMKTRLNSIARYYAKHTAWIFE